MGNVSAKVSLVLVGAVDGAQQEQLLAGICALELSPGQDAFVGDPAAMAAVAMADPQRHLFAILPSAPESAPVGMGVLHVGAATDTGWPDPCDAVLLRGFLVDRRSQGLGYGKAATLAAVELASSLVRTAALPARGVVLGVNERNAAGLTAYRSAGFADHGQYLGGRSGPRRIMFTLFVN